MKYFYLIGSVLMLMIGIIGWAYMHNIIIINTRRPVIELAENKLQVQKKVVTLWLWHKDRWKQEKTTILYSPDVAVTILHIINRWLVMAYEEQVLRKKIVLETVCLSGCKQKAYASFNRNLFSKQASIFDKTMLIESLLKTVRENDIKIQEIQFLVSHYIMSDFHLDFNQPWPLNGYVKS